MTAETAVKKAEIPESYFEYGAHFRTPMFSAWVPRNKVIESVYAVVKPLNVGLADITWSRDSSSLKDLQVTFNVQKLNVTVRIGLEGVSFATANPDWSKASALVELLDAIMTALRSVGGTDLESQEVALALHITPGDMPFSKIVSRFVNTEALGGADTYGVSAYRHDSSFVIDRSVRYADSVFVRLHRKFAATVSFKDIAAGLHDDESKVLSLLGLQELLE